MEQSRQSFESTEKSVHVERTLRHKKIGWNKKVFWFVLYCLAESWSRGSNPSIHLATQESVGTSTNKLSANGRASGLDQCVHYEKAEDKIHIPSAIAILAKRVRQTQKLPPTYTSREAELSRVVAHNNLCRTLLLRLLATLQRHSTARTAIVHWRRTKGACPGTSALWVAASQIGSQTPSRRCRCHQQKQNTIQQQRACREYYSRSICLPN